MANAKAIAELRADNTQIMRQLKEVSSQMTKTFKTVPNQTKPALKGLVKELGGLFAIAKINGLMKESIELSQVQAKAEADLANTLGFHSEKLHALANEQQKLTLFGDEATIAMQAQLGAFIKNEDQIAKLTPLVQDYAQKFGVSLVEAGKQVAKSVGSSTNALSRNGIEMTGTAGSAERLESAMESLTKKVGGTAESAMKAVGPLGQVDNSLGDIKETIGDLVSNELQAFAGWFVNSKDGIITAVKFVGNAFKVTFKGMALALNAFVTGATTAFGLVLSSVNGAIKALPDSLVPDSWAKSFDEADKSVKEFNKGAMIGLGELKDEIFGAFDEEPIVKNTEAQKTNTIQAKEKARALKDQADQVRILINLEAVKKGIEEQNRKEAEERRQQQLSSQGQAYSAYTTARAVAEINHTKVVKDEQAKRDAIFATSAGVVQGTFKNAFSDIVNDGENAFVALSTRFQDLFIDQALNAMAGMATNKLFSMFMSDASGVGGSILGDIGSEVFGFASGTPYASGGPSLVGENGPEVVNLPQGASVQPNNTNNTTNNFSSTINITQNAGESNQDLADRLIETQRKGYNSMGLSNYGIAGAV